MLDDAAPVRHNAVLLQRLSEGDESALDEIVSENMGLVRSLVSRFGGRAETEDLMQIGTVGLIRAARGFDLSLGCAFSTYAVPLILGEIRRYLRDDGPIKVSRTLKQTGRSLLREQEAFLREMGRDPQVSELAARCGLSAADTVLALEAVGPVRSLNEPVGDDGLTLEGVLTDGEDPAGALTDRLALREAVAALPALWQKIVALRYIRGMTQQKTGRILGLSQVKVSREEKKILSALKESLGGA